MTKKKQSTEAAVRDIRRRTRRKFSPEEKIRIVLEGLRGEIDRSRGDPGRRLGATASEYSPRVPASTSSAVLNWVWAR